MRYNPREANKDVREYARAASVFLWKVAGKMGISDATMSRRLRRELPEDKKAEIRAAIDALREA